jgi:hypothetical protein
MLETIAMVAAERSAARVRELRADPARARQARFARRARAGAAQAPRPYP